ERNLVTVLPRAIKPDGLNNSLPLAWSVRSPSEGLPLALIGSAVSFWVGTTCTEAGNQRGRGAS
ncbi:MAG: hypothetical protein QOH87_3885, partial [Trebonia sp.]|nr:hypothetical protein [Trebonia sp.]